MCVCVRSGRGKETPEAPVQLKADAFVGVRLYPHSYRRNSFGTFLLQKEKKKNLIWSPLKKAESDETSHSLHVLLLII